MVLTDPKLVELTPRARRAFLAVVGFGPPDLIPCFFRFRHMLHSRGEEVVEYRKGGIELGWIESVNIPVEMRDLIGMHEVGFSFGTPEGDNVLHVDHDGCRFILILEFSQAIKYNGST